MPPALTTAGLGPLIGSIQQKGELRKSHQRAVLVDDINGRCDPWFDHGGHGALERELELELLDASVLRRNQQRDIYCMPLMNLVSSLKFSLKFVHSHALTV